ncbi:uncharacterized protein L969DRAFT_92380 [Mixia osmundae IAM 14324]|uniref:Uncharacterized protein n=1 Tax=Mixia osmundae (strain CBS 9802 / IAM 14324 / JCM 22182 / KY 12970) TaxID=764103 RepID=G7DXQ3_MIXOS|nr:uncharacterized protein L969DRAFT_92380 [Mixia osmundae IAM 14324]KEI41147.1 hypothetical protein L969DRAFT_92380 [Mixia osmundae IAM 14324]GAA95363.1 hypothetical protein E5Q_02020 [Mixia osmundae IAM 14324]
MVSKEPMTAAQLNMLFDTLYGLCKDPKPQRPTAAIYEQVHQSLSSTPEFQAGCPAVRRLMSQVKYRKFIYDAVTKLRTEIRYDIETGTTSQASFEAACARAGVVRSSLGTIRFDGMAPKWQAIWASLSALGHLLSTLHDQQEVEDEEVSVDSCISDGASILSSETRTRSSSPTLVDLSICEPVTFPPATPPHLKYDASQPLRSRVTPGLGALEQFGFVVSHITQWTVIDTWLASDRLIRLFVTAYRSESLANAMLTLLDLHDPDLIMTSLETILRLANEADSVRCSTETHP